RCFFFQAEDGIRDKLVTGVQTCALPIYTLDCPVNPTRSHHPIALFQRVQHFLSLALLFVRRGDDQKVEDQKNRRDRQDIDQESRSEERRVGKECRYRGGGGVG